MSTPVARAAACIFSEKTWGRHPGIPAFEIAFGPGKFHEYRGI